MGKRLLALFITIAMIFSLVSCADGGGGGVEDDPNKIKLDKDYNLVMANSSLSNNEIFGSALLLKDALEKVCGLSCEYVTDREDIADSYNIYIGPTSNPDSIEMQSGFKMNDYGYKIVGEKTIVITGGTGEGVKKATEKFCSDVLGYEDNTGTPHSVTVMRGTEFYYKENYEYETLTICGIDVSDFTIASSGYNSSSLPKELAKELGKYTGQVIPVVNCENLTGEEKGVIVIGAISRDGSARYPDFCDGYMIKFIDEPNGALTIAIDAKEKSQHKEIVDKLLESATLSAEGEDAEMNFTKTDLTKFHFEGFPKWELQSETKTVVCDGVTQMTHTYKDEFDRPYVAFSLHIDPDKVSFTMGNADDGKEYVPSKLQDVKAHMQAAVANGKDVIAGINADFFRMEEDCSPRGLVIKDGELISKGQRDRAYVALTRDGRVLMGVDGYSADTTDMYNAWGAWHMIVMNGAPGDLYLSSPHSGEQHPRTLMGVTADGKIILANIDGRNEEVSNGASLVQASLYMISLGVENAVELDGGGSTCMIIRDGEDYDVINTPSDGSLRKVYNSVLVIKKSS